MAGRRGAHTSRTDNMLKHKIRKSRKNILNLLESAVSDEKQNKVEYTKVNKKAKREKERVKGELPCFTQVTCLLRD